MDQPVQVANPPRVKLNREKCFPLSQFAPETFVALDRFVAERCGSLLILARQVLPSRPAAAYSFSTLRLNQVRACLLWDFYRFPRRRPFIFTANRQ